MLNIFWIDKRVISLCKSLWHTFEFYEKFAGSRRNIWSSFVAYCEHRIQWNNRFVVCCYWRRTETQTSFAFNCKSEDFRTRIWVGQCHYSSSDSDPTTTVTDQNRRGKWTETLKWTAWLHAVREVWIRRDVHCNILRQAFIKVTRISVGQSGCKIRTLIALSDILLSDIHYG